MMWGSVDADQPDGWTKDEATWQPRHPQWTVLACFEATVMAADGLEAIALFKERITVNESVRELDVHALRLREDR